MKELESARSEINSHLRTFLAHQSRVLHEISPSLDSVAVALSEFILDSGKRLRPLFAYAGAIAAGKKPDGADFAAMGSLELLQACALIHDDVMDRSDTRRGKPSIHRRFENLHNDGQLEGSASLFGDASAILLGDLALIWSDQALHSAGLSDHVLLSLLPTFDEMRVELMAGQFLDVYEQGQKSHDADRSLRIARFKSGKYTIERPLHFGAIMAGGSRDLLMALSHYGLPLGEAFQLRDDLLGVFGDPEQTGKPAGDDLREGKRTVLIAMTHEGLAPHDSKRFSSLFGRVEITHAEIEELRSLIRSSGADHRVEELIEHLTSQSLSALDAEVISHDARDVLTTLSTIATKRSK